MIVIDGEQFKIDVLSVKRSADFLDKYAERLANGHLRRELIGVYFNYGNASLAAANSNNTTGNRNWNGSAGVADLSITPYIIYCTV